MFSATTSIFIQPEKNSIIRSFKGLYANERGGGVTVRVLTKTLDRQGKKVDRKDNKDK